MIVGTLKVRLALRDCHSLKEKRSVLSRLKSTLSGKFNIAVAEVEDQDVWQSAEIGIATVGTDTPFIHSVLSSVINYVKCWGGVQVVDYETETYGD